MHRRSVLIIVAIVIFGLALVAPSAAQDKPRSGGELVFVVPSEPPSYDAHQEERDRKSLQHRGHRRHHEEMRAAVADRHDDRNGCEEQRLRAVETNRREQ